MSSDAVQVLQMRYGDSLTLTDDDWCPGSGEERAYVHGLAPHLQGR